MKIIFFSLVNSACIYLILLNFFVLFNVVKSSNDFRHRRYKKQASSIDNSVFRCINGQIIDLELVCDGKANCTDLSDESLEQCKNTPCPSYGFRCGYGACIDSALKCNGKYDCIDRSDESQTICPQTNVITVCNSDTQFQCVSQQCIDKDLLCDGKRDCIDGSDETYAQCHNEPCNTNLSFRCKYGACVDGTFKCDGKVQCADGSDESDRLCNKTTTRKPLITTTSTTSAPLPAGHCRISTSYVDKTATYECADSQKNCVKNGGTAVTQFTVARFACKPGYYRVVTETDDWACIKGEWRPKLPECEKMCDRLVPINVDLTCYRGNITIDCHGPLITGDHVTPTCKRLHTYKDFAPTYQELICQEDGKWDNVLFSCTPKCGQPFIDAAEVLIKDGRPEKFGDSPWHIAIYDISKGHTLICGGTIINPYLVISAAHCFFDKLNRKKLDSANYEVFVGKFTRDYTAKDNSDQKSFKLKEIRFSDRGYYGVVNYHSDDIAILVLKGKIDISPTVLPACIDWAHVEKFHPPEGTPGKVVGWGTKEDGKLSDILLAANLPFISNGRCLNIVPDEFKPYVTYDKFCAGNETGPGVLSGDSGGGLMFREGGFYYLRGIVSSKAQTATSIATFTDIGDHIRWISQVRNEVERDIIKQETTLTSKT